VELAFCEKENMLICIDCILSDGHKNHEMESISNVPIQQLSASRSSRPDGKAKWRRSINTASD
jgi:hypothetical protein